MPFIIDDIIIGVLGAIKIYKELTKDVVHTEHNPAINGRDAKRLHVEQLAIKRIDELDINEHVKGELKRNITPAINEVVGFYNDNGIFAHDKKSNQE